MSFCFFFDSKYTWWVGGGWLVRLFWNETYRRPMDFSEYRSGKKREIEKRILNLLSFHLQRLLEMLMEKTKLLLKVKFVKRNIKITKNIFTT